MSRKNRRAPVVERVGALPSGPAERDPSTMRARADDARHAARVSGLRSVLASDVLASAPLQARGAALDGTRALAWRACTRPELAPDATHEGDDAPTMEYSIVADGTRAHETGAVVLGRIARIHDTRANDAARDLKNLDATEDAARFIGRIGLDTGDGSLVIEARAMFDAVCDDRAEHGPALHETIRRAEVELERLKSHGRVKPGHANRADVGARSHLAAERASRAEHDPSIGERVERAARIAPDLARADESAARAARIRRDLARAQGADPSPNTRVGRTSEPRTEHDTRGVVYRDRRGNIV